MADEQNSLMPEEARPAAKAFLNDLFRLWATFWRQPEWRGEEAVDEWWHRAVEMADEASGRAAKALPESEQDLVNTCLVILIAFAERRNAGNPKALARSRKFVDSQLEKLGFVRKEKLK